MLLEHQFGHGRSGNGTLLEHERYHGLGMDALATVCSWNTNVIMLWAWAQWQPYALGTRTLSCFGHGCSGNPMLLGHERYHGLGTGAVATVCSWNTNVIMLGMDALATICSWNANVIMVWAWAQWQPYALGTRTLSCFGHGCSGNRMLLEHERYHGLGMDALATLCSWNTNVIMIWAWAQWQPYDHRACCAVILTRCRAVVDASTSGATSKWPPVGAGVSCAPHMALQPSAKL